MCERPSWPYTRQGMHSSKPEARICMAQPGEKHSHQLTKWQKDLLPCTVNPRPVAVPHVEATAAPIYRSRELFDIGKAGARSTNLTTPSQRNFLSPQC